ncbi:MAG: PspC domain-containing protein [Flavobacterium sp.]|nr:MAG: PspC domain-containing protein [Flavobacterium sp.]
MNKTVNINLGGMFFHIDEDAYQKLTRYFDAIKRSLSNSTGQDEIIKDIEMRIAELISEKHSSDKQVINVAELDEIIAVMGQPEDYRIEGDAEPEPINYTATPGRPRKLYRDKDGAMVGGVLAGLGHYFGIDKVWLRIILLVLFFCWGIGLLAYIILWIVMPEAITTAEKLEMRGEPVTIANIERKVREEVETLSQKYRTVSYDKMGNEIRTGVGRAANNAGDAITRVLRILAKIFGAIIVFWAGITLIGMLIALFTFGSSSFIEVPWQNYVDALNYTNLPLFVVALLFFFAVGIPFFILLILGLKLVVRNLRSLGSIVKYALLAVWLISVGILITVGIRQATEVSSEGKTVMKQELALNPGDTVKIRFRYNDYFAKDVDSHHDFQFTQDEAGKELIYSNNVQFTILKAVGTKPYIQIEKQAHGKTLAEARKRSEKINYTFEVQGNQVILDNYLVTDIANKYRDQRVEIFLYLPEGMLIKPDSSVQDYDASDDGFFNLHYSGDYLYKVGANQVKCLDCPADENDWEDVEGADTDTTATTTVTVNADGVRVVKGEKVQTEREFKGLEINEDGIIIKTK